MKKFTLSNINDKCTFQQNTFVMKTCYTKI